MPVLLLIRHGENDFVGKALAGRLPDVHLNDKGREQAGLAARLLAKAPIKAIFSSPLERAMETAAPLAEILGLTIQTAPGLIELDYGEWQGQSIEQLQHHELWSTIHQSPSQVCFPGGENMAAAQQRAVTALEEIRASLQPDDLVACFSHGDIIRMATAHYLDMPFDSYQRLGTGTASLTVLDFGKNGLRLPYINQSFQFEWPQEPPAAASPEDHSHVPPA